MGDQYYLHSQIIFWISRLVYFEEILVSLNADVRKQWHQLSAESDDTGQLCQLVVKAAKDEVSAQWILSLVEPFCGQLWKILGLLKGGSSWGDHTEKGHNPVLWWDLMVPLWEDQKFQISSALEMHGSGMLLSSFLWDPSLNSDG